MHFVLRYLYLGRVRKEWREVARGVAPPFEGRNWSGIVGISSSFEDGLFEIHRELPPLLLLKGAFFSFFVSLLFCLLCVCMCAGGDRVNAGGNKEDRPRGPCRAADRPARLLLFPGNIGTSRCLACLPVVSCVLPLLGSPKQAAFAFFFFTLALFFFVFRCRLAAGEAKEP